MKKILVVLVALMIAVGLSGCATKNDKDMYGDYTMAVTTVSSDMMEYFSTQLAYLAESIPYATTPLERHLIRESIVELRMDIQKVERATNGNDVVSILASKADRLLGIIGSSAVAYKGIEVLGDVMEEQGGTSADNGSTININKEEAHNTTVGDNNVPTNKEPVIIEVPLESTEE
jgi:hypothetical protein